MVAMAHMVVEMLPEPQILPEGAISAAWHIAQDPIKLHVLFIGVNPQIRQKSCIIINYKQRG